MAMRISHWTLAAALVLAATAARSDPVKPPPAEPPVPDAVRVEAVVVPLGKSVSLQTKSGQPIRSAFNSSDNTLKLVPDKDNPRRVILTDLKPGVSRITLTDVQRGKEDLVIAVEQAGK